MSAETRGSSSVENWERKQWVAVGFIKYMYVKAFPIWLDEKKNAFEPAYNVPIGIGTVIFK